MSRTFIAILRPSPKKGSRFMNLCIPLRIACPNRETMQPNITGRALLLSRQKSRFNSNCDKNQDVVESKDMLSRGNIEQTSERSLFRQSHSRGAQLLLSPLCLHLSKALIYKLCWGMLSALLVGEGRGNKIQVPKAIIKLPKPFLLLFNLFVANPANNTLMEKRL